MTSKRDRLKVFFDALCDAPPVHSADEAFELLCQVLNDVEDSLSGVPFDPPNWATDGRMYPPQQDRATPLSPTLTSYRSAKHITLIGADGSIEITDLAGKRMFRKEGHSG